MAAAPPFLYPSVCPSASILGLDTYFLSIADGDSVTLVGLGSDRDHFSQGPGIINYTWFDENGAIQCKVDDYDDDGNPIYECEKEMEIKAGDMDPGKYHYHLKVQDNEGNWSAESDSVTIYVFENLHQVFLPVTMP